MSEELNSLTNEIPRHAREGLELLPNGLLDDYTNAYGSVATAVKMYLESFNGGSEHRPAAIEVAGMMLESMPKHYVEYLTSQHTEPALVDLIERNAAEHAQQVAEIDALVDQLVAQRPLLEKMAKGTATKEEVLALRPILESLHEKASGRRDLGLDESK